MLKQYDVIVVGAGHAGCEAANAAALMGSSVLLITMNMMDFKIHLMISVGRTGKSNMLDLEFRMAFTRHK
jgi:tRNA U34 5-carboxymethylaminomethyl modifying enzyme MnmG/GidA